MKKPLTIFPGSLSFSCFRVPTSSTSVLIQASITSPRYDGHNLPSDFILSFLDPLDQCIQQARRVERKQQHSVTTQWLLFSLESKPKFHTQGSTTNMVWVYPLPPFLGLLILSVPDSFLNHPLFGDFDTDVPCLEIPLRFLQLDVT